MKSAEQKARDMLERSGVEDAQASTVGDLVEIANLIADNSRLRSELEQVTAMREALQKLEYIYFAYNMTMVKRCPVCGSPEGDKEHSFDTDCWLAAALKGGKG